MKKTFLQEILLLLICLISIVKSDLVIMGPEDLISRYHSKPIEIVFSKMLDLSYFYVHGEVFYENMTIQHTACTELRNLPRKVGDNGYSENFKILLAYNGDCSIIQKARNAQSAGASMLLLINNNDQDIKNVILEGDGSGSDIKIPVALISLADGKIMENYMVNNPNSRIMIEINFEHRNTKNKKVEFKLFFSSSELKAYEFIHNITKYLEKFSSQVEFTPIYITHRSVSYNQETPKRILNCFTNGKYCYFPKETTITQDGQRILMESLRQKCMYKKTSDKLKYYYEYMQSYYQNCLLNDPPKFNERCAKQTLDTLGYPVDYLDSCIADSFGVQNLLSSTYIDNENKIFQKDYDEILKYGLTAFPAVVINNKPLEGIIKETKVILALCNEVRYKPDFCSILNGEIKEHLSIMKRKKGLVYSLIVVVMIIYIILLLTFREYIKKKVDENDPISIDGRIKNFMNNVLPFQNTQNDYQKFDTSISSTNNKGYNKIEGSVSTI